MKLIGFLSIFLLPFACFSQYDTLYVKRFPGWLGVGVYQSKPVYEVDIENKQPVDTGLNSLNYQTLASYITGVGLAYDKLSLFAGIKTAGETNQQKRKGKTGSSQFGLAFTGLKLRAEAGARFYSGFYENNSPLYIPSFSDTTAYYQNAGMKTSSYKFKLFYFFNRKKRFSYGAAYINNTRQLKSAGSFLLTSNLYYFGLKSDNPIIPVYLADKFGRYDSVNKFTTTGLSAGIGYTHTFTIGKRLFLNLLAAGGIEGQHLKLSDNDSTLVDIRRTIFSAYDLRSSLGYNSNRFYFSFQTIIDGNLYRMNEIEINNVFINAVFLVGYRFRVKIPVIDRNMNSD